MKAKDILDSALIRAGQIIFGGFLLAGVLLLLYVFCKPVVVVIARAFNLPLLE